MDDNTLVQKLLSKPSFTFDDCTKYALEYEQTEDRLGTYKKNTGITVNAVTAQELSPGKQINQTALVCERCDKPGHRAHECIMPVEKLPTHKIPKWYLDKLKRKQQHNSKRINHRSQLYIHTQHTHHQYHRTQGSATHLQIFQHQTNNSQIITMHS